MENNLVAVKWEKLFTIDSDSSLAGEVVFVKDKGLKMIENIAKVPPLSPLRKAMIGYVALNTETRPV